eukprot:TRINITY_DN93291_c0_g1_i1.p1 TRINITY_DN93291_c0_g1~~TRINITY_DN93291_c0_g1_i1.p1  ORF type:complete len:429 (-),score=40.29 TRINITY_DN93291_c0_g1_i1:38-1285(-)
MSGRWILTRCLSLLAFLRINTGGAQVLEFPSLETWSYSGQQYWENINGAFCAKAGSQSPIDIGKHDINIHQDFYLLDTSTGRKLGPAEWTVTQPTVNVTLNPGSVTWNVTLLDPSSAVTVIEGLRYELNSITFKSPTEHTVNGGHNALEIQLNHVAHNSVFGPQLLVASVSMAASTSATDNLWLASIWSQLQVSTNSNAHTFWIGNPYTELLPEDRSFVMYKGSQTAPPCDPATWMLFMQPGRISYQQLEQFRASISGYTPSRLVVNATVPDGLSTGTWDTRLGMNNRDVQALSGRDVTLVMMANSTGPGLSRNNAVMVSSSYWLYLILLVLVCLLACLAYWLWQHHFRYDKGGALREVCCAPSDSESGPELWTTSGRSFHPHEGKLPPFPEVYTAGVAPRAGFGNQDRMYISAG